jgi:hypothetical protein
MNNEMKHTPGTWYWSARTLRSEVEDEEGDIIERPDILHVDSDKCVYASEADRNLIASSPRLLAALQRAVDLYGKPGGPWNVPGDPGGWLAQAREAIAEATGQQ